MGRVCHAMNCFSKSTRKEVNVQFHKMPSEPEIRKKWIEICQVPSKFHYFKTLHICSKHFKSSAYCQLGTRTMLKKDALPSIFFSKYNCLEKYRFTKRQSESTQSNDMENEDNNTTTIIENQEGANQNNEIDSLAKDKMYVESFKLEENREVKVESIETRNMITEIKMEPIDDDDLNLEIGTVEVKIEPESPEADTDTSSKEVQIKDLVEKRAGIIEILEPALIKIEIPVTPKFLVGQSVGLNHFDDKWYNGVVLQIDNDENEILVEFEKVLKSHKEWIRMDSNRLRIYDESSKELGKENEEEENYIKEEVLIEEESDAVEEQESDAVEEQESDAVEEQESDGVEEQDFDAVEEEQDFDAVEEDQESDAIEEEEIQKKPDGEKILVVIGQKVELNDFNNWHSAVIVEIDNIERELLLKYETNFKKHVEWIPMNSKRIRVTHDSQTSV